jgi:hypothetical protein
MVLIEGWLFLAIEEIHREHGTDYLFFAKQKPTLRITYSNPAVCGECDVEPLSTLSPTDKNEFAEFCQVRYGIDDIRECHAIYAESQRMANERRGQ